MDVRALLNLLNELGKSDKVRGLPSIFIAFVQRVFDFNAWRYFTQRRDVI